MLGDFGEDAIEVGRLRHPFYGPLFRLERDPLPLERLAPHTTIFAAIWPDAFEARIATGGISVPAFLESLYPTASAWWETVRADELFRSLSLDPPFDFAGGVRGRAGRELGRWKPSLGGLSVF